VREEKTAGTKIVPSSATRALASTTSTDTDDAPMGAQNDISDDHTPDQEADGGIGGGDEADLP
jgi:hypothetical protein